MRLPVSKDQKIVLKLLFFTSIFINHIYFFMNLSITSISSFSCSILKSENHIPKRIPQFAGISTSFTNHLSNIRLNVSVHGNSDLNVGNKINLIIPQATTIGEQEGQVVDKYLSGFYMIKTLRHKINDDQMVTIMEVMKDTEGSAPITQNFRG